MSFDIGVVVSDGGESFGGLPFLPIVAGADCGLVLDGGLSSFDDGDGEWFFFFPDDDGEDGFCLGGPEGEPLGDGVALGST